MSPSHASEDCIDTSSAVSASESTAHVTFVVDKAALKSPGHKRHQRCSNEPRLSTAHREPPCFAVAQPSTTFSRATSTPGTSQDSFFIRTRHSDGRKYSTSASQSSDGLWRSPAPLSLDGQVTFHVPFVTDSDLDDHDSPIAVADEGEAIKIPAYFTFSTLDDSKM